MADFEAPSFSIGLDFELPDSMPHITTTSKHNISISETILVDDDDDDDNGFETITVVDLDPDDQASPPILKRLRRGSAVEDTVSSGSVSSKVDRLHCSVVVNNGTDEHLLTQQHHSVCKSSKFPLNGHEVLTKQSGNRKQKAINAPESVITSCSKPPIRNLSASPLRRFQLIDSDSDPDDPYISEGAEPYLNRCPPALVQHVHYNEKRKSNETIKMPTKKDLREDFKLDEVCEEYFSSIKDKTIFQSSVGKNNRDIHATNNITDLGDPLPPAHRYYCHNDPRVQDLVRARLRNFFPINVENKDSSKPSTSSIDYMGQFRCIENSEEAARTYKAETSSGINSRISQSQETYQSSANRKFNTEKRLPKDAGYRRVQADGKSASAGVGHWFTTQYGKRVYVSKNGQELTGGAAYILYKKESGAGFNK